MKKNNLRYSKQREDVLKTLHSLSSPVTAEKLTELISEDSYSAASYPTIIRHINFYKEICWLTVINRVHKRYILVKEAFPTA